MNYFLLPWLKVEKYPKTSVLDPTSCQMFASLWNLIVEVFALHRRSVISYSVLFLQVLHKSTSQVINFSTELFSQHFLFFMVFHGKEQYKMSFNYLCWGMYHKLMSFIINVYIEVWQTNPSSANSQKEGISDIHELQHIPK